MTVVIRGRAVLLGEDGLGCLADLDSLLVVILIDLLYIDRLNVRKCVVYSDLAVVRITGLNIKSGLVFLLSLLVIAQLEVDITSVEVVDIRLREA